MLKKIQVTNFKSFKDTFVFNLGEVHQYTFNQECIKNGIVNKGIIYGMNGSGKSNIGLAIFDLIGHTTNKYDGRELFLRHYVYAGLPDKEVSFEYTFEFNGSSLIYSYSKKDYDTLIKESLFIDELECLSINRNHSNVAVINLPGAETLNKRIDNSALSIISYIRSNANLDKRKKINKIFYEWLDFLDGMLFFRTLKENIFIGHSSLPNDSIPLRIIKNKKVKDFEMFLNAVGIECVLTHDEKNIFWDIDGYHVPFYEIASSGTEALATFYYWFLFLSNNSVSFLFIDEFDAFFHHDLTYAIVAMLKKKENLQVLLTTHSTSIMTNDLLRPDCYFVIDKQHISSLPDLTFKELRQAHNLEKMYRGEAFRGDT